MYEAIIAGMTDHVKICKKSHCCIKVVAESVISGNSRGYINTNQPIREMPEKNFGEAQTFEGASQYHSDQDKTKSEVMP
jgi:hypothetical protein